MNNQEKKVKSLLTILLFQFFLVSCQTSAESNVDNLVLFEKQVENQGKQYKLVIRKGLTMGDSKLCDSPDYCQTATLQFEYFLGSKRKWNYRKLGHP